MSQWLGAMSTLVHRLFPLERHREHRAFGRRESHAPLSLHGCPVRFDLARHRGAALHRCMGSSVISFLDPPPNRHGLLPARPDDLHHGPCFTTIC
jgi:hypothetical protein